MQMPTFLHCAALSISGRAHMLARALWSSCHISMYVAQGPISFHRAPHRLLNIQLVVKPNDTREPLLSTTQQISIGEEASGRELDEDV